MPYYGQGEIKTPSTKSSLVLVAFLVVFAVAFIAVCTHLSVASTTPQPKTYYLGDTIANPNHLRDYFLFGGICRTNTGYCMTIGFDRDEGVDSKHNDFFIEVSVGATVNIGHTYFKVVSFTTDSVTLLS